MSDKDSRGELKPFPFCGHGALRFEEKNVLDKIVFRVGCANPDSKKCAFTAVQTPQCHRGIDADKIWNTRPITPKEEWISVEKGLPEKLAQVFVKLESGHRGTAQHIPAKSVLEEDFISEDFTGDCSEYDEKKDCYWVNEGWWETHLEGDDETCWKLHSPVTHWMPLPSPPTKDQTEKCNNPKCENGGIFDRGHYIGDCPDCNDQTERLPTKEEAERMLTKEEKEMLEEVDIVEEIKKSEKNKNNPGL